MFNLGIPTMVESGVGAGKQVTSGGQTEKNKEQTAGSIKSRIEPGTAGVFLLRPPMSGASCEFMFRHEGILYLVLEIGRTMFRFLPDKT